MVDDSIRLAVLEDIAEISKAGTQVVLVHGGGPFINNILTRLNIQSEFIDGHRKTSAEAIKYIEMALTGEVNASLVRVLNTLEIKAVGLSGKDAGIVVARKRYHFREEERIDLGWVGDVDSVDPSLINDLLSTGYVPVLTCLAPDTNGNVYNINADMFAGHIAAALHADEYIVLTDVDGLLRDKDDPTTLISSLTYGESKKLMGDIIVGGMIPKIESCGISLENGAKKARIINGTKKGLLPDLFINGKKIGTSITN